MSDEMKRDGAMRIFEALSSVDEELLERSEEKKKVIPFWRYSKVMAACICLVVLGAAAFATTRIASDNATGSDCAVPMAEMVAEDARVAEADVAVSDMETGGEYVASQEITTDVEAEEAPAEQEELSASLNESNTVQSGGSDGFAEEAVKDAVGAEIDEQETDKLIEDNCEVIMDWGPIENAPIRSDEETLRGCEVFGAYVPTVIPAGYVFSDGCQYQEEGETIGISLNWCQGLDHVMINVCEYDEEEDGARIVDISKPETYDVHLYEIPYSSSVPDEVRTTFNTPIFKESDFGIDVIEARMKSREDAGDTNTPRGNFAVLYDSGILVSFTGRGEAQEIWKMFESIKGE